ncbi:uncharacterized protein LOC127881950 [Dreissena polymorpha]|uniref:Uncharacterized protein n=1 Tax=Dreissena polymorpha TaxID=45954 RepID=A0A9D4JPE7_DREPO|nr:uncharacterized protein LOC127881950 [Dreissena polymorpha]KAH3816093.1 hypothetical protein DPMN_117601 [Dreissena polymorpha]
MIAQWTVLTLTLAGVRGSNITQSLTSGVCMCVNEPNCQAVRDPTDPTTVLGTLSNGACFTSLGGIYHKNDVTFYQLRDNNNGQTAWVDSFFLNAETTAHCNRSATITSLGYHIPRSPPAVCVAYGQSYNHGDKARIDGAFCTCDDGLFACSMEAHHCFTGGIVYHHGTTFHIDGRGDCSCLSQTIKCIVG